MKKDPYRELNYRSVIDHHATELKTSYKELSGRSRVHPSYFSRVMKGDADFSPAQMFSIAKALGLDGVELEFCLLLVEHAQSTEEAHRFFLLQKIRQCQKSMAEIKNRLTDIQKELSEEDVKVYYQEAITAKVHMLTTIASYRQNMASIAKELNIEDDKLEEEMRKLEKLGLIRRYKNEIEQVKMRIHLPEDHPLSKTNHLNWRLETIYKLGHTRKKSSDYHFSANFSASEKEKEEIKSRFKDFVVDAQKIVSKSEKVQKIYHIGFDLY